MANQETAVVDLHGHLVGSAPTAGDEPVTT
jgi:hypothetical protein